MNSKKVYMNRFHKLLCKYCTFNDNGKCQYYLEPLPVCHCRVILICKKKYNIQYTFDIIDKEKSIRISWK